MPGGPDGPARRASLVTDRCPLTRYHVLIGSAQWLDPRVQASGICQESAPADIQRWLVAAVRVRSIYVLRYLDEFCRPGESAWQDRDDFLEYHYQTFRFLAAL
jgi:hypothetical protein